MTLPLIKPIQFAAGSSTVQLCDVRSQFVRDAGLNGLVGDQMQIAWKEVYGEEPKLDGTETESDPNQVGFIILLDSKPIGSGMFIEVGIVESGNNIDATGRLVLKSDDFRAIITQIIDGADGYEAEVEPGQAYNTVTFHLAE